MPKQKTIEDDNVRTRNFRGVIRTVLAYQLINAIPDVRKMVGIV